MFDDIQYSIPRLAQRMSEKWSAAANRMVDSRTVVYRQLFRVCKNNIITPVIFEGRGAPNSTPTIRQLCL